MFFWQAHLLSKAHEGLDNVTGRVDCAQHLARSPAGLFGPDTEQRKLAGNVSWIAWACLTVTIFRHDPLVLLAAMPSAGVGSIHGILIVTLKLGVRDQSSSWRSERLKRFNLRSRVVGMDGLAGLVAITCVDRLNSSTPFGLPSHPLTCAGSQWSRLSETRLCTHSVLGANNVNQCVGWVLHVSPKLDLSLLARVGS